MSRIDLVMDGDGCWRDLTEAGRVVHHGNIVGAALLPDAEAVNALTGERRAVPAVTLRIELADGSVVLAQLKLEAVEMIARAFRGRLDYLAGVRSSVKGDA